VTPLRVGDVLHGFCGGAFGRDHYECSRVEAIAADWVVVRSARRPGRGYVELANGNPDRLAKYRDGSECRDCVVA
jgi:hypothetical protein